MPTIVAIPTFFENMVSLLIKGPSPEVVRSLVKSLTAYGHENGCTVDSGDYTGIHEVEANLTFNCENIKIAQNLRALYGYAAV